MSTGDYSENTHEQAQPLELEHRLIRNKSGYGFSVASYELEAATTEPARPPEASNSVEGLSIAEAATAYGLSVSSIRRLLKAGKIPGAAKVPGSKGSEYRLPPEGLEALGYTPKETQSGAILTAARANLEAEELARKVKDLEATLALEVVRRESAEKELKAVSLNLDDLREALAKIPRQLEAPKKRGLFRRKS